MIGMIQVSRDVLAESSNTARGDVRKEFAKRILASPQSMISIFASLVIVDLDTTNWATFTEAQKISGGKTRVAAVFNEAGNIY
jgi:hypothetical protein